MLHIDELIIPCKSSLQRETPAGLGLTCFADTLHLVSVAACNQGHSFAGW